MSDSIMQLAAQLTRIFVPIIIVTGVVSNVLNIILLTRPALIHHACSLYFLALAINNLFYSSFLLLYNLLADGYQIDPSVYSVFFCKLISYLLNLCPNLSVYFIVLASIDRYCASSISVQRRRFNDLRIARWAIGILILILALVFISAFVAFDISHNGVPECTIQSDKLLSRIFLIADLTLYAIIAPVFMIFFGFLTIYNTKKLHFCIPVRISRYRRTEKQLSRMLLLQVATHSVLTLPFCITFFMLILPSPIKFTIEFAFAYVICKLPFYLTVTTAFFLYVLSARAYRNELIRLYNRIFQFHRTIHPIVNNNNIMRNNITPIQH